MILEISIIILIIVVGIHYKAIHFSKLNVRSLIIQAIERLELKMYLHGMADDSNLDVKSIERQLKELLESKKRSIKKLLEHTIDLAIRVKKLEDQIEEQMEKLREKEKNK